MVFARIVNLIDRQIENVMRPDNPSVLNPDMAEHLSLAITLSLVCPAQSRACMHSYSYLTINEPLSIMRSVVVPMLGTDWVDVPIVARMHPLRTSATVQL